MPQESVIALALPVIERATQEEVARLLGVSQPSVSRRRNEGLALLATHFELHGVRRRIIQGADRSTIQDVLGEALRIGLAHATVAGWDRVASLSV
jgi:predicted transcriptional regulator